MAFDLITILGPTACGKTKLAAHLAYAIKGEIISADSRQVYKGMDLGTGKDIEDYVVNGEQIPYHLIDILNAGEKYHVFRFKQDFYNAYQHVKEKNNIPILCGGSGMYIESILRNYNLLEVPENTELRKNLEKYSLVELTEMLKQYKSLHNKTDVDSKKRAIRAIEIEEFYKNAEVNELNHPALNSLTIGLNIDRDLRREKISRRLKTRIDEGMIDEVKRLMENGISADDLIYYGLEYKYITEYVLGYYSFEVFFTKLETAIHQFAKRQMTYFRGMERRGISIYWLDAANPLEKNVEQILHLYNS